jgi:hypothetical protein
VARCCLGRASGLRRKAAGVSHGLPPGSNLTIVELKAVANLLGLPL